MTSVITNMHEILIRQISIISVSLLNLAITASYCWLTYRQKIKPALAMWIFFTIAVAISLATYLQSDNFSIFDNILNTTDVALASAGHHRCRSFDHIEKFRFGFMHRRRAD